MLQALLGTGLKNDRNEAGNLCLTLIISIPDPFIHKLIKLSQNCAYCQPIVYDFYNVSILLQLQQQKRLKKLIVIAAADLNGSSGLKQEPDQSWVEWVWKK